MKREIKIFKSLEEQELYHLELMRRTTPLERFIRLFQMQQLSRQFHPIENKVRFIIIHKHGHTK
jgi:hypothetical protein